MKIKALLPLLAVAPLVATAGPSKDVTYRLMAHYRNGEQHRYSVVTAISGMVSDNKAIGLQFAMRYQVVKTLPASTKIRLTYANPKSGKTPLPIKFPPALLELDRYNRPVRGSQVAQIFAAFPNHPVKIGDKWTASFNLALGAKGGALLDVTYKLTGVKRDGPRTIAVLGMKLEGLTPGEGTALVDANDGSVLSTALNVRIRDKQNKSYPVEILMKREA